MQIKTNSPRAWLLAARPKTLTAALIPVAVAAALAVNQPHCNPPSILICALFASLMQVAANLINDLIDFLKGTDRADRLGPERACAQGWITPSAMRIGIILILTLALACGSLILLCIPHATLQTQILLIAIGLACVAFAFLYTTILSYAGMGDLLVLIFFGIVPCCGTHLAATGQIDKPAPWLAGLVCGILIDTLLILNNYRDRDTDRACGKQTLVAKLGEPFGRYFYLTCGLAAWLLTFSLSPLVPVICLPYLPLHIITWRTMARIRSGRALNRILGQTSRNMAVFGILLAIAILYTKA